MAQVIIVLRRKHSFCLITYCILSLTNHAFSCNTSHFSLPCSSVMIRRLNKSSVVAICSKGQLQFQMIPVFVSFLTRFVWFVFCRLFLFTRSFSLSLSLRFRQCCHGWEIPGIAKAQGDFNEFNLPLFFSFYVSALVICSSYELKIKGDYPP